MESVRQAIVICIILGGIIGFAGGFVGEVLYAARLLNELRKVKAGSELLDSPFVTLSLGWIASVRVKRLENEFVSLAGTSKVVANSLPKFLRFRRVRQISSVALVVAIIFLV